MAYGPNPFAGYYDYWFPADPIRAMVSGDVMSDTGLGYNMVSPVVAIGAEDWQMTHQDSAILEFAASGANVEVFCSHMHIEGGRRVVPGNPPASGYDLVTYAGTFKSAPILRSAFSAGSRVRFRITFNGNIAPQALEISDGLGTVFDTTDTTNPAARPSSPPPAFFRTFGLPEGLSIPSGRTEFRYYHP